MSVNGSQGCCCCIKCQISGSICSLHGDYSVVGKANKNKNKKTKTKTKIEEQKNRIDLRVG